MGPLLYEPLGDLHQIKLDKNAEILLLLGEKSCLRVLVQS